MEESREEGLAGGGPLLLRDGSGYREDQTKTAASADFAPHLHGAPMGLHGIADEKQAKSAAAGLPLGMGPVELLEDGLLLLRRNADAVVLHLDEDVLVLVPQPDRDGVGITGILARVVHQVEKGLPDLLGVEPDRRHRTRLHDPDHEAV